MRHFIALAMLMPPNLVEPAMWVVANLAGRVGLNVGAEQRELGKADRFGAQIGIYSQVDDLLLRDEVFQ
jgi:hypothetical protein